jgi:glutamate-1-semialdehyde 2,1-aminomutase
MNYLAPLGPMVLPSRTLSGNQHMAAGLAMLQTLNNDAAILID